MKPKRLASLITVCSLALAVVHLNWPRLNIDAITLGLLAFALLPWLRSIIKSVELPGGVKLELQEYAQSTVDTPAPPAREAQIAINAALLPGTAVRHSAEARKILRTLCHYQNQLFPNESLISVGHLPSVLEHLITRLISADSRSWSLRA